MIKKFMSKALLSVFMDKKARTILHTARATKETLAATSNMDSVVALTQSENDPLGDMDHEKIRILIRESLKKAEEESIGKKIEPINKASKSVVNQSREELIENALIIFKSRSHIIDELPAEQRKKLKLIAFQVFGDQLKDG